MYSSMSPSRSSISSVAGCVVAARGLSSIAGCASKRDTEKPFWAQAKAATTPTGPAPATIIREGAISSAAEIARKAASGHADSFDRRGSVAAAPNKTRRSIRDHGSHRRDVAVAQRVESRGLRTSLAGVQDYHIGIASSPQETAVQTVDASVVPSGGCDRPFDGYIRQAGQMRDGVHHAERHDAAPGRRVRRDQESIELTVLTDQTANHQQRPEISGGARLERNLALM